MNVHAKWPVFHRDIWAAMGGSRRSAFDFEACSSGHAERYISYLPNRLVSKVHSKHNKQPQLPKMSIPSIVNHGSRYGEFFILYS